MAHLGIAAGVASSFVAERPRTDRIPLTMVEVSAEVCGFHPSVLSRMASLNNAPSAFTQVCPDGSKCVEFVLHGVIFGLRLPEIRGV